jgi:hypothetical protein
MAYMKQNLLRYFLVVLALMGHKALFAQAYVELFVSPSFNYRMAPSLDSTAFKDAWRLSWSTGFNVAFDVNRDARLITGFTLSNMGYTGVKEDMQFLDSLHPNIGRIEDLSQTSLSKDAFFYHKFSYLQIPLLLDYNIGSKYKQNEYRIGIVSGFSANVLLQHRTDIFLKGFSVAGDNEHTLEPSDFQLSEFNVHFHAGAKFGLNLQNGFWLQAQPSFQIPFASSGSFEGRSLRLTQVNLQVGICYPF